MEKYVSISDCPPVRTIYEYATHQREALDAKKAIDEMGCGGQCKGASHHFVMSKDKTRERGLRNGQRV